MIKLEKFGLVHFWAINWFMVTLDLLTTNNLFYFHPLFYEANILGNIPLLEYSIFPLFILIYLYGLKYNIFRIINKKILVVIAFLPIVAVINNLFFILKKF